MPFYPMDFSGQKFGRLTAISRSSKRGFWLFRCDCGAEKEINSGSVRAGDTKSCGCLNIEQIKERSTRHGLHGSPTYVVWNSMKARCENRANKSFANYGGRGIVVCERWSKSFDDFLADMGERPRGLTLERIDNEQGYQPGNCRWATMSEQARNKRTANLVEYRGRSYNMKELAEETGLARANLWYRIIKCGLSAEDAVAILRRGKWRRS